MFHKVIIMGNLGRDPELRYIDDGTPVCNFSVATNNKWSSKDGTKHEETTWFRITAWRGLAETVNRYMSKGKQVYVEGTLKSDESGNPRTFERGDGITGASYEVTANTVRFLGNRNGDNDAAEEAPVAAPAEADIPF